MQSKSRNEDQPAAWDLVVGAPTPWDVGRPSQEQGAVAGRRL